MFKLKNATIRAINYTRYIALPKQWLANMGLAEGDHVNVWLNRNGNIEIAPAEPLKATADAASP